MIEFMDSASALEHFPHSVADGFVPVGTVEAELLCIDESTDQPVLLEHEVAGQIAARCAGSQSQFITAIQVLEEYFSRCGDDESYADDESAGLDAVSRASDAAGGHEYASFYHSLVGY